MQKQKLWNIPVWIFMLILSILALLPFYLMIMMGTHYNEDLYTGVKLFPGEFLRENFQTIMRQNFFKYYGNSLFVSTISTLLGVFVSALTGYAFAKFRFKGRGPLLAFVVATLAIPQQLGLIGFVVEMRELGWINTFMPLIITGATSAFGVFWMTQYISSSVPSEIVESGRVDGCGEFSIFFRLIVPIIVPATITIGLLLFLWSWNSYMTPLVVIMNEDLYTIPLAIALISSEYRTDYAARILALAIGTIPLVVLFALGSKHLIRGLVSGSVKG